MHDVRWFAFVPALILAPLALAVPALGLVAISAGLSTGHNPLTITAFITFVAAIWGAPVYLTFGAAGFVYGLKRWGLNASFWAIGLAANLISAPVVLAVFWLSGTYAPVQETVFMTGFGCIFAPLWGGLFGWIYRAFVRKGIALREAAHGPC